MIPQRCARVATVEDSTHAVLLNLPHVVEQQSPYYFEGAAFQIWSLIDGVRTEEQIVDALVDVSGARRELVARDTRSFLDKLLTLGLIKEQSES